ncbi:unc-6, partial [Pristionchus pacificus]
KFRMLLLLMAIAVAAQPVASAYYFSQFSMRQPDHDPCHDNSGRPVRCVPEFINAAFGKPVVASDTCGMKGATKFCSTKEGADGVIREECSTCDATRPHLSHPASYLTDLNNPQNMTCWVSEPSMSYPRNVSLTLSLGKKFELTYVSMQFCNRLPDSMALYKSADHGRTWSPFQFYSTQCEQMYGRRPDVKIEKHNEQEARCTSSHTLGLAGNRVAFPFLEDRPSAIHFEQSPVLQDWVTATDIRVVFSRLSPDQAELYGLTNDVGDALAAANMTDESDGKERYFYSMGELAVGGRCKCNGHAARCIYDKNGQMTCDCKHNTAGTDCERCKPFHYDRPWARATAYSANACVACNCNLHAKRCRFDSELFKMSGDRSGGVCINCRHNTAGRNCHLCKPGFFRDPTKPITHRKVCTECNCHPVGSIGSSCNQTSGQCLCKPGVTGLICNKCAKGFVQSRSTTTPCIRVAPLDVPVAPTARSCPKCRSSPKRLNQKKFCKRDYALQVHVVGREILDNGWARYTVVVESVMKKGIRGRRGQMDMWQEPHALSCKCPRVKVGRRYLLLGKDDPIDREHPGLVLNAKSLMIEWDEDVMDKVLRFSEKDRAGLCPTGDDLY